MIQTPAPLPRGPFFLLGLMTATTILGPFLIGLSLHGGESRAWPPDRPIEWATVVGTSVAVLGLMGACLSLGMINRRAFSTRLSSATQSKTSTSQVSQAEVEP